jgi:hypothetical protein
MNYKIELERLFKEEIEKSECPTHSKLAFLGSNIFDFTTYDSAMDELFAKKMIEVIDCIIKSKTFEYQNKEANYINYLTMVNMPFLNGKLEWGTSIRGAWFDEYGHHSEPHPAVYKIGSVDDLIVPKKEIKYFMKQLVEWSRQ